MNGNRQSSLFITVDEFFRVWFNLLVIVHWLQVCVCLVVCKRFDIDQRYFPISVYVQMRKARMAILNLVFDTHRSC